MVADTVAAPIEQQVTGVEGMLYMSSQSGNDGSYSLSVTFNVGTDLNTALVMVQNRVMLAMPLLPTEVQNQGIQIRKRTPDILMIVSLYSPDRRYDNLYLSNYALIHLNDELLRLDGVADSHIFGERDYSIRAWLDPQKMAALGINAGDAAAAIGSQNLDVPTGQLGAPPASARQPWEIPINALGRLSEPEQFGDIIVKAGPSSAVPMSTVSAGPLQNTSAAAIQSIANPLQAAGGSANATNSSAGLTAIAALVRGTSGTGAAASTPSATTSGGTSSGGGTTGGGATSAGGGTTGGGATSSSSGTATSAAMAVPETISNSTLPALSTSASGSDTGSGDTSGAAASSGPTSLLRPPRPAAGIVRLRDIARVEMGALNYLQAQTFDGHQAVGIAVFQLPGTNALDVADRVKSKMKELRARFPEGIDYQIAYDITPFISESIADVVQDLVRGRGPGGPGGAGLPAELAERADPHDRRARGHHRHLRGHEGDGLQFEQYLAVRAGAGGVHRGGRRHRGRGERRSLAGSRPAAPRGRAEGHDGGYGPDHRRGAGALRRVRALRVHRRNHGPLFPPVRRDDRRFHRFFGHQFAHAQPGPGRHPAPQERAR